MFFDSVKKRNASKPPSLPTPESFCPPKGVLKSRSIHVFTQTIPVCNCLENYMVLFKLFVHKVADNPYFVSFANCKASSSVLKDIIVTIGPKISS